MKNILKHLLSFILPFTVLVIVPMIIESGPYIKNLVSFGIGSLIIIVGLSVMAASIWTFARIGKGTLAPWSPTQKLVIFGVYRYVRNPMIMGVITVLIGESIAFGSVNILVWAVSFFLINTIYFLVYEEPDLENKFGAEYNEYRKHVRRWWPRVKPYKGSSDLR